MSKRALIVDDSRSARVILSRMLEGYGLEVDSSESAEHALEFLRQARPDVIFMDHLMPGMDGFQAIQAIKGNPDTATIPVIMYTSQEGELYVSQARALGAVGVLPKTVKHADVSRVLYQLRLLPERREGRVAAPIGPPRRRDRGPDRAVRPSPAARSKLRFAPPSRRCSRSTARRCAASCWPVSKLSPVVSAPRRSRPRRRRPRRTPQPIEAGNAVVRRNQSLAAGRGIAALALIPTLGAAVIQTGTGRDQRVAQSEQQSPATVKEQQSQLATLQQTVQGRAAALAPAAAARNAAAEDVEFEPVPYGEAPLAGSRLERLRDMLPQLQASGFRGKVKIATFVGEFCLPATASKAIRWPPTTCRPAVATCVGNPFEDGLPAAQRQSLAFANLVSSLRQETGER